MFLIYAIKNAPCILRITLPGLKKRSSMVLALYEVAEMLKFPRKEEGKRKKKSKEWEKKGKEGREGKERRRER